VRVGGRSWENEVLGKRVGSGNDWQAGNKISQREVRLSETSSF